MVSQWLFRNCSQTPWPSKTLPLFLLIWLCVWEHTENSDTLCLSQLLFPTRPPNISPVQAQDSCSARDEWIGRALSGLSFPCAACAAFQISRDLWELIKSHLNETRRPSFSHSSILVLSFLPVCHFIACFDQGYTLRLALSLTFRLFATEIATILDNAHRHGVQWSMPNQVSTPQEQSCCFSVCLLSAMPTKLEDKGKGNSSRPKWQTPTVLSGSFFWIIASQFVLCLW